jgi:hypothetical protein
MGGKVNQLQEMWVFTMNSGQKTEDFEVMQTKQTDNFITYSIRYVMIPSSHP